VCIYLCVFTLPALFTTHAQPPQQQHAQATSQEALFILLPFHHLYLSLYPSIFLLKNSDLLATQRSSAESYNDDANQPHTNLCLFVLLTHIYLYPSIFLPNNHNSDLLATQRSSAESYNEDTSPTAGGGLTLQQQTQLLAILAGAGFQGGKQQEQGGEAEARPA